MTAKKETKSAMKYTAFHKDRRKVRIPVAYERRGTNPIRRQEPEDDSALSLLAGLAIADATSPAEPSNFDFGTSTPAPEIEPFSGFGGGESGGGGASGSWDSPSIDTSSSDSSSCDTSCCDTSSSDS